MHMLFVPLMGDVVLIWCEQRAEDREVKAVGLHERAVDVQEPGIATGEGRMFIRWDGACAAVGLRAYRVGVLARREACTLYSCSESSK